MQDLDPDKTRVVRQAPHPSSEPAVADTGELNPNQTVMMQPSQRARAAAADLQVSQRERESNQTRGDFQWSGQVDFDVTTEFESMTKPPKRWPRITAWCAGTTVVGGLLWWIFS
ncbi:MAG: hypothetical protein EXR86_01365 [Gammaproteobacteria bacterium]|nr:hypothetical protein [Gammaproteobacteria bacterium]